MALPIALIEGTDTLESGFRAKSNSNFNSIVVDGNVDADGNLILESTNGNIEVPLSDFFATKGYASGVASTPPASETVSGRARIATDSEVIIGTNDSIFVTPLKLLIKLEDYFSKAVHIGDSSELLEVGNEFSDTKILGSLSIQDVSLYRYSVVDGNGVDRYSLGVNAYETHFEGDIEVVGKVSVGQGALIIEKKLQESQQASYVEIGAEHYINVTAPEINVLNTLGVNEIVSISEFPIEVNSKVNFNSPIYITDSDEPKSAISRIALQNILEVNYWKVGGNVDVTGDMVFDIVSAYYGEVQQQPYDYFWKINGINKMQLSDEALDIKTRIKLKGVSATENQVLTSDGFKEVWSLIGVQSIADIADNYQALLNGVGFVKMNGTEVSYEQFGEFGQYLNSSENPNIFDAPWGASYVASLITNLPNGIYQGHSIKMSLGEDKPEDATFLAFGLPNEDFDSKLYARGVYGGVDTGWKAIGGDISDYRVYSPYNDSEIDLKGFYYEFTQGDKAIFAGIDKTHGTYDILMKSANNLGDTINDYRNYIDTETGRWHFQNGTNTAQKYLLAGEVAGGGSGTSYTLEEPLFFIGNEINIREASGSQDGFLTSEKFTEFDNKVSDGDTINNYLDFADTKALYFGYESPSVYDARIYHNNSNMSLNLQTEASHLYVSVYGEDKDINLTSQQGAIKFAAASYFFSKGFPGGSAVDIEIDMSGFATGKVLTATSSTKAEWVTP